MRGALAQSVAILLEQETDSTTRFQDVSVSLRLCDTWGIWGIGAVAPKYGAGTLITQPV